jgi:hypothetical protein
MVGRQGFEPWKPMATDLQSAPFVHLGTCPNIVVESFSFQFLGRKNKPSRTQLPCFLLAQQGITVQDGQQRFWKQRILQAISTYVK